MKCLCLIVINYFHVSQIRVTTAFRDRQQTSAIPCLGLSVCAWSDRFEANAYGVVRPALVSLLYVGLDTLAYILSCYQYRCYS